MTECQWCGRVFAPRASGGKPQQFCQPACRRALDAAGRQWISEALASGWLTSSALRDTFAATRALAPTSLFDEPILIWLDEQTGMQVRELAFGHPLYPAEPAELAEAGTTLFRQGIRNLIEAPSRQRNRLFGGSACR